MMKESSSIATVDEMEHFAIDSARQLEVIVSSPVNDTFIALARSIAASSHTLLSPHGFNRVQSYVNFCNA